VDVVGDPLDDVAVRCFVHRPAVLARVKDIGIDFAQGLLLHQPQPLTALPQRRSAPMPG
jgi:EAL domain-containing protein (putative c-di-GMP-specific phosphodiesterase class I)